MTEPVVEVKGLKKNYGKVEASKGVGFEVKAEKNEPVLLLDSGDFLIGTLYHLLAATLSPELTLMNRLEYDAATLGNHEFEWGPQALARIIDIARTNGGGSTVPIVASNIRFNFFDSRDNDLKELYDAGVIQPYLVKSLSNGLKVGIIGLLGNDAEQLAPLAAPVRFNHSSEFIQHIVTVVRSRGVDLVILLSHSGLDEDKKLAKLIRVTADTIISWELRSVKRGERNMRNAERFLELQQLKPNLSTCQSV